MNAHRIDIVFVGVGSAFCSTANWQSNMILEVHTDDSAKPLHRLLLDCGSDARHSLKEAGIKASDIEAVYISHAHGDHIGGLEWLALMRRFSPQRVKPELFINRALAKLVWQALEPGLDTLQNEEVSLNTYFDVRRLPESGSFDFGGQRFDLLRSIHFMANRDLSPSYGLQFTAPDGCKVLMPTDTQFAPKQLMDFYKWADIIFQDCETSAYPSGVHAHFTELSSLPPDLRAKMWLYHYQDGDKPDCKAAGFGGWIEKGRRFIFAAPI